jgi:ATP-dependent exoDNAse (exonuclease V) beta subunit
VTEKHSGLIKRIIRASAGTGKTYRLSLELIWLLLSFRHQIDFSEILVITFTRKATFEIRERIFEHLSKLVQSRESEVLEKNLYALYGIKIGDDDRDYLKSVFQKMLLNKHRLQISTIDSFVNSIFKTVISPYLGFSSFQIVESIPPENIQEINEVLLSTVFSQTADASLQNLFSSAFLKNITAYDSFIKSIIYNRWQFMLFPEFEERMSVSNAFLETTYQDFVTAYRRVMSDFVDYLFEDNINKPLNEIFKKEYHDTVFKNSTTVNIESLLPFISERLADSDFVIEHYPQFISDEVFWNGSKVLRKKIYKERATELSEALQEAQQKLATFLLYKLALPEEANIRKIANLILTTYDEIKFRDRILTFNDITFYTYKYLHDPGLSLIEGDSVTNLFYEYLSTSTRFILIDEFQDTSVIQFKILMPILREILSGMGIKDYGGAIIVGDEKQAIYGWRGGERDLLLKMPEIVGPAEEIDLDTNYRSHPNIIRFVNQVFSNQALHDALRSRDIIWPFTPVQGAKSDVPGYVSLRCKNVSASQEGSNISQNPIQDFIENVFIPYAKRYPEQLSSTVILARRNDELKSIADFLDQHGIEYVYESTSSIFEHRAVKPVMYLLSYFVYRDISDLLKFLRSDFVLLPSDQLKDILLRYRDSGAPGTPDFWQSIQHIPAVQKINSLYRSGADERYRQNNQRDILTFVRRIYEAFAVTEFFRLDNDLKNINSFLGKIALFQYQVKDYTKTVSGFLQYYHDNSEKEKFRQEGLEEKNAVKLMTIHQSKGLEFETVFLLWRLSMGTPAFLKKVKYYLQYNDNYTRLDDFFLTFNYDNILACSDRKDLHEENTKRDEIETLNTIYVAMTRAISNLYLYFSYRKKGGIDSFLKDMEKKEAPAVQDLLFRSVYAGFQEYGWDEHDTHIVTAAQGEPPDMKAGRDETEIAFQAGFDFINEFLDTDQFKYFDFSSEPQYLDFKSVFLKHKSVILGNIVHYYLSFIRYGHAEERHQGLLKTLEFYGTLVSKAEIERLIEKTNLFIDRHPDLFSETWQVFTEYTVFSPQGREYRIDRLLIDKTEKKVLIVDYKTGQVPEEKDQLQQYKQAIADIPYIRQNQFKIDTCFFRPEIE